MEYQEQLTAVTGTDCSILGFERLLKLSSSSGSSGAVSSPKHTGNGRYTKPYSLNYNKPLAIIECRHFIEVLMIYDQNGVLGSGRLMGSSSMLYRNNRPLTL